MQKYDLGFLRKDNLKDNCLLDVAYCSFIAKASAVLYNQFAQVHLQRLWGDNEGRDLMMHRGEIARLFNVQEKVMQFICTV